MFNPALTTCASERMKTQRFSYFAGFAARELMREAKPVKLKKVGFSHFFDTLRAGKYPALFMYVLVAATATAVVAAATAVVATAVVAATVVKAAAENEQQYDDPPNVVTATAGVAAVVTAAATTIIAPAEDQQEDYDPPPMLCTVVILLYRLRQPGENLNLKILRIGAKPANGAGVLHAGQHHA